MKKLLAALLALLMLVTPALGETIVTSFYPIYVFALNLLDGVEGVTVANMTDSSAGCLHDYQLQTGDMKLLARADAFLINGAGMEGFLTSVYDIFPEMPVVDASRGVTLLEDSSGHDHDHAHEVSEAEDAHDHAHEACEAEDDHDHEHETCEAEADHDHEHEACEAEADHDHEHETSEAEADHSHLYNAHIWLDAQNAVIMVNNLAEGLTAAMPQHAAAIETNRAAYVNRLNALDAEMKAALAGMPHMDVITFHEAFPYFVKAYGLHVAAVINREPDEALSPRALAELCATVVSLGSPPLFVEPQYEDLAAQTIARDTGAQLYILDPMATGPEENVPLTLYEDVMRQNLQVLLEALGQ